MNSGDPGSVTEMPGELIRRSKKIAAEPTKSIFFSEAEEKKL
jgi:hypothetical protein